MDIKALVNEIERVNQKIAQVNTKSTRDAGRKEEISKQVRIEIEKYYNKYGVKLDVSDEQSLKAEFDKVVAEALEKTEQMKKVIDCVERGSYTEACLMMGVSQKDEPVNNTEPKVEEPKKANNETLKEMAKSEKFIIPDPDVVSKSTAVEETKAEVVEEVEEIKEEPVLGRPTPVKIPSEVVKAAQATFSLDFEDDEEEEPKVEVKQEKNEKLGFGSFSFDDEDDEEEETTTGGGIKLPNFSQLTKGSAFQVD